MHGPTDVKYETLYLSDSWRLLYVVNLSSGLSSRRQKIPQFKIRVMNTFLLSHLNKFSTVVRNIILYYLDHVFICNNLTTLSVAQTL